jgi:hypothetical protein
LQHQLFPHQFHSSVTISNSFVPGAFEMKEYHRGHEKHFICIMTCEIWRMTAAHTTIDTDGFVLGMPRPRTQTRE